MARGWVIANARSLGLPDERDVIAALEPALVPDPRGPGKLHARDAIGYSRPKGVALHECESIAHIDGTDDYSRFRLLEMDSRIWTAASKVLGLIPAPLRRDTGRMSADYFRYGPGAGSPAHQDGFGDFVVIWVLDRNCGGAESFLTDLGGRDIVRGPLSPGQLLIFRDEMFLHGLTPLRDGHRDALIFITLKDGA